MCEREYRVTVCLCVMCVHAFFCCVSVFVFMCPRVTLWCVTQSWYPLLRELTFHSEFLDITVDEARAMVNFYQVSRVSAIV